ncbi:MAG: cbb3-type cytochrome c oxidase subunit I [Actinomycetota bacterium]
MTPPPATTLAPSRPELVTDGFPQRRPRWIELATSVDHKDVGRMWIGGSLGFLFVAVIEWLLMRLQLAIPENTLFRPEFFNRLLSLYGETAIFLFAIPLMLGLFCYLVPLQIGARTTALPRLGQLAFWMYAAGAAALYGSLVFTPPEAGVNPLPPLSELAFSPSNGMDVWLGSTGLICLGFVFNAINMLATLRNLRAPGLAWRRLPIFAWAATVCSLLLAFIATVMVGAITMLLIDRNLDGIFFSGEAGGAPLLWQHLSWIFYSGAYMLIVIAALGAIAEIVPALSRKPLFHRGAVMGSLVAIAVLGTLAWMQNMYSAPLGIGWAYFAMAMAMLAVIPFGLVLFNLIATMVGGALRMRAPLLFALGAIAMTAVGLISELSHSMVAVAWQLQNTTDATASTHYALVGAAVFGGFAALYFWFPKMTGRTMGEYLARISFWTMLVGLNVGFFPLFLAGLNGQVVDTYKYFDDLGVNGYNLIATIGAFVLAIGILLTLVNAVLSRRSGAPAGHDPWGGSTLEWFAESPPPPHNFDVLPDVRGPEPLRDIRDAIAEQGAPSKAGAAESQPVA